MLLYWRNNIKNTPSALLSVTGWVLGEDAKMEMLGDVRRREAEFGRRS